MFVRQALRPLLAQVDMLLAVAECLLADIARTCRDVQSGRRANSHRLLIYVIAHSAIEVIR